MYKYLLSVLLNLFYLGQMSAQTTCQWAYIPTSTTSYNYNIANTTVDLDGNIIQVGKIVGMADMDPGSEPTQTSYSASGGNIFVSKTTPNGQLMWIRYFTSPSYISFFEFKGVKVNSANEIVILGNYYGLVDFDLSPGVVDTLRSKHPTYPDYFVAKYNASGLLQWVFSIGHPGNYNFVSHDMTIQANDRILIAANPTGGAIDVDPGPAVHNSIGSNGNLMCYDNDGNYLWNNNVAISSSGVSSHKCVESDAVQNTYMLTVGSYELSVNKFNSSGARVWNKKIGNFPTGARVAPTSIVVDKPNGGFYINGTFGGTVDFDPGVAIVNQSASSGSYQDGFIAKYDSSMNLIWVKTFAGNVTFGKYSLDFSGADLITVGRLTGSINFGNGITLSSVAGQSNPFYIKFSPAGVVTNGYTLNGTGGYNSIHATSYQSYHTTGNVTTVTDMDPTAAVFTLTPGSSNHFNAAYGMIPSTTVNLNILLEGYYDGGGFMKSALNNQGHTASLNSTDSLLVELRDPFFPYLLRSTCKPVLNTNGTTTCLFYPYIAGSFYLRVLHRNTLPTWSSVTIPVGAIAANYDFTDSASAAYGTNQFEVSPGVWAFYSGDLNGDENIDLLDLGLVETDISNFQFGYFATDINGDGNVDLLDTPILESNINNFIYSIHP